MSNETLRCTTLGDFKPGTRVNLEKAMQATDRFGGHIVSGHVDGVGELVSTEIEGKSQQAGIFGSRHTEQIHRCQRIDLH